MSSITTGKMGNVVEFAGGWETVRRTALCAQICCFGSLRWETCHEFGNVQKMVLSLDCSEVNLAARRETILTESTVPFGVGILLLAPVAAVPINVVRSEGNTSSNERDTATATSSRSAGRKGIRTVAS